jgi:hypothetical protein
MRLDWVTKEDWRVSPLAAQYKLTSAELNQLEPSINALYDLVDNKLVIVNTKAELPTPSGGIITLADNITYFICAEIDLLGDRLVCGQNTTIIGGSSENCRIKSTGLATALITSEWSLPIRSVTIEAAIALDLDANGNSDQALDWFGVNFSDCPIIGTIANYNNFIASDCGFINSGNLTFDGSIGTVGFSQCIFDNATGATSVIVPATATISRRLRFIYSAFISLSGETALNVSDSASILAEGFILDNCNFSGGGTYLAGVQSTSNKARFLENRGIDNSSSVAYYTIIGNATPTDIITQGVAVKIAGTTTANEITQKFTVTQNRATYIGALTQSFKVSVVASCTSANNAQIGFYVAKNGVINPASEIYITTNGNGRAEGVKIQDYVSLSTNDYIEVFVENDTNTTDVVVISLNVIID